MSAWDHLHHLLHPIKNSANNNHDAGNTMLQQSICIHPTQPLKYTTWPITGKGDVIHKTISTLCIATHPQEDQARAWGKRTKIWWRLSHVVPETEWHTETDTHRWIDHNTLHYYWGSNYSKKFALGRMAKCAVQMHIKQTKCVHACERIMLPTLMFLKYMEKTSLLHWNQCSFACSSYCRTVMGDKQKTHESYTVTTVPWYKRQTDLHNFS